MAIVIYKDKSDKTGKKGKTFLLPTETEAETEGEAETLTEGEAVIEAEAEIEGEAEAETEEPEPDTEAELWAPPIALIPAIPPRPGVGLGRNWSKKLPRSFIPPAWAEREALISSLMLEIMMLAIKSPIGLLSSGWPKAASEIWGASAKRA